jgi:alkenylglycerophosphocholine hydrolase
VTARRLLAVVALAGVIAYLAAVAWRVPGLGLVAKPVPVLCLAAAVFGVGSRHAQIVGAGLVLSATGDVLLERPGRFLAGLAAFLAAHLVYLAAFVLRDRRLRPGLLVPFLTWTGSAAAWLWGGLGALRGAVLAYMAAITAMMWRAAVVSGPTAWGAALFGLSDTLIALDRFGAPIPHVRYPIILLYWAGQTGIALGALRTAAPAASSGQRRPAGQRANLAS